MASEPNNKPDLQRSASLQRKTGETEISLSVTLDGQGTYQIDTGNGFLDHMVSQIAVSYTHLTLPTILLV